MKRYLWAGVPVLLAVTVLWADDRTRLYSDPSPPPREVLDRLNLKQEWTAYVPMDGRKDGFVSVHLLDGQMFVQTRSGAVAAYNAETGRKLWHTSFGKAYLTAFPLAINSFGVYAVNGGTIYALDRATGSVRWKYRQPEGLSAAPVVDDEQMYLSGASGRMYGYFLPIPSATDRGETVETAPAPVPDKKPDGATGSPYSGSGSGPAVTDVLNVREPQPTNAWDKQTNLRLEFAPLPSHEALMSITPNGNVIGIAKYMSAGGAPDAFRFTLDDKIAVPPGRFEDVLKNGQPAAVAYIGTETGYVYAISISGGKQYWRFTLGTPTVYPPAATNEDVFVTGERSGMFRLNRVTGAPEWRIKRGDRFVEANPDADRFLAANAKFVYAADKSGRLLVLDRGLGTEISSYDTRDFAFPISNDMNDRLYLAANNGLIVCLHDKEYTKPVANVSPNTRGRGLSPEDRIKLAKDNLARKISNPGTKDLMKLTDAIDKIRQTYQVKIFLSDRAFTEANLQPISDKPVLIPKVEDVPLGDFLKQFLGIVGATYELVGDVVQVLPLKDKRPPDKGPEPMPKPEPMPPKPVPPG